MFMFFFFSSRRRHTRYWRDWSSDVCSSDLADYTCAKTGNKMAETTNPKIATGSLREEIVNQRRIELWGEFGRLYDLRRLHQGVYRTTEQGHPGAGIVKGIDNPDSNLFLMTIPQSEFDGNKALDAEKDQNPMD